jgi:hypothetical protein
VVVVSATDDRRSSDPCEIRVLDVDSGTTLAQVQVGDNAEVALSPHADMLAVLSQYRVTGIAQPRARLEVYRIADLSLVIRGYLPVPRNTFKRVPTTVQMQFAPDGTEIVVQKMKGHDDVVLTRVLLELDEAGVFKVVGQPLSLTSAAGIHFLRADWPQITVFGQFNVTMYVLDLDKNADLSRFTPDPAIRGNVVTSDGKHGYYIPRTTPSQPVVRLQRVDLTANPPKAIHISDQPQPALRARVSAVSEEAGALFIAEQKVADSLEAPSQRIKVFHTLTLTESRAIEVSLSDCYSLTASCDGKYLYALDFNGGISVVEISSGTEIKTLKDVGAHPAFAIALP